MKSDRFNLKTLKMEKLKRLKMKSKSLGSGVANVVAMLKLKQIDGRAPPVEPGA